MLLLALVLSFLRRVAAVRSSYLTVGDDRSPPTRASFDPTTPSPLVKASARSAASPSTLPRELRSSKAQGMQSNGCERRRKEEGYPVRPRWEVAVKSPKRVLMSAVGIAKRKRDSDGHLICYTRSILVPVGVLLGRCGSSCLPAHAVARKKAGSAKRRRKSAQEPYMMESTRRTEMAASVP